MRSYQMFENLHKENDVVSSLTNVKVTNTPWTSSTKQSTET